MFKAFAILLSLSLNFMAAAETVTVYSVRDINKMKPVTDTFFAETGIDVKMVGGTHDELMARLKSEDANTPADVFITKDLVYLSQTAREGLFVPFKSAVIQKSVPAAMRDPQDRWFGITYRARVIMYNKNKVNASELSTYADLANPKWKGRLCLRNSGNSYNTALIGWFISTMGGEKALAMLTGWAANAGANVLEGDTKVLEALAAGQCDVGVTNTYYLANILKNDPNFPVAPYFPDQHGGSIHTNGYGAGMIRDNSNARAFLEYLVTPFAQEEMAAAHSEYPVVDGVAMTKELQGFGTFKRSGVNWMESGDLYKEAGEVAKAAGYK